MSDYNRNSGAGGGRRGGGSFRGRNSGRRQMHDAVCDECGDACKVPFRPSGGKPIYCSSCFEKKDGGASRGPRNSDKGRSGGSGFENRDNISKQLLEQVSLLKTKLDRILMVLESGSQKKPAPKKIKAIKVVKEDTPKVAKVKKRKVAKKVVRVEPKV